MTTADTWQQITATAHRFQAEVADASPAAIATADELAGLVLAREAELRESQVAHHRRMRDLHDKALAEVTS